MIVNINYGRHDFNFVNVNFQRMSDIYSDVSVSQFEKFTIKGTKYKIPLESLFMY